MKPDSFDIRGYAPNVDPMDELPPNAGAKRPPTGPFRAFLYPRPFFPVGLETSRGAVDATTSHPFYVVQGLGGGG